MKDDAIVVGADSRVIHDAAPFEETVLTRWRQIDDRDFRAIA